MTRKVIVAVFVLAALSLLLPSIPTYDPYAWIIWGREITEGALTTTQGPSWKPLPVAFTTVFALFGDAAPWLWLVVARAGAIAALLACWHLVRRLDGGPAGAAAAVAALALAPWWLMNAALGNSEGLMVFFVLAALERMTVSKHRAAFALACGAALLRPEIWPFLAVYALWLMWRQPVSRTAVLAAGAAVIACWLLPEWWGSGDLFRAANRARTDINPLAPTNAESPILAVLGDAWQMLVLPVVLGLAAALWDAIRNRDRAIIGLVALSLVWLGVVAVMTRSGFSGNQRYLIVPVALLIVASGAGLGRALTTLSTSGARRWAVVAATALLFAAPSFGELRLTWDRVAYQESMTRALPDLIARAGGAAAIRDCGFVSTGRFLVPQLAWQLNLHLDEVSELTKTPGTVFVVQTTATSRWGPPRGAVSARPVAVHRSWHVYQQCRNDAR
jgi:hypothetical protein